MSDSSNWSPSVVFVTGASSGFGEAVVRRFVARGAKAVAVARRKDRLDALVAELGSTNVHSIVLDVADVDGVAAAVASLPPDFAAVDLLVNNAGLALGVEPTQRAKIADWERVIDTNCKGVAVVTMALVPGMIARGRGHIVNLGSVAGTYPYPGGNVYGASKAFVHQLSLNLRNDLHGTGVRVTCIEPGMCETEFSEVRFGGDRAKAAAVYAGMKPLGADDIARAIEWAATQPPHVNVNVIELMPVAQSFGAFNVDRSNG